MRERAKKYQDPITTKKLGSRAKGLRIDSGLSLGDIVLMTGFPKATIISIENGSMSDISYYIAYAQAIETRLSVFFNIEAELKPRFELPENRKKRLFLTFKIRALQKENDFFNTPKLVDHVATRLYETYSIQITNALRTNISTILKNLVEDGILKISGKEGRNNLYTNY